MTNEAAERLLSELQENPLPGARYAYTIVRDRLPAILAAERSAEAGYGGLIAVAETASREGFPLHCATRTTCAEHIAEGDDQKDNWAFGQSAPAPLDVETLAEALEVELNRTHKAGEYGELAESILARLTDR